MIKKYWIIACIGWCAIGTALAQDNLNTLKINNNKNLKEFFRYTPDRIPLICGHRGGAQSLYPENSIAGLEYVFSKMTAFFEVDPRLTKDSVVVVLHDATLDRTTNGTGKLSDYTWEEIQKLRLKDKKGNLTEYRIRTLDEVMRWARGKTILMLDKKDVPLQMLYNIIKRNNAENGVLISAYQPEEAAFYYSKNKNLMFEVFVKDAKRLQAFEATGVPTKNMVAYFGQPKKQAFYDLIHSKGIMVMIYTGKILEKEKDKAIRIQSYKNVVKQGGDILLSDRALEAYESIIEFMPVKSSKDKFFNKKAQ